MMDNDLSPVPRKSTHRWVPLLLFLLLAGTVAGYYVWREYFGAPMISPPPQEPAATPAPVAPHTESDIQYPVERRQITSDAAAVPLPTLEVSDAALHDSLASLFHGDALTRLVRQDDLAHRFVVTIDNLLRPTVAQRLLPFQPVAGAFVTVVNDGTFAISNDNAARYSAYVRAVESFDTQKLIGVYIHFYPLFQRAYEQLGYPKGYFNDRLIAAIDDLLATPEPDGPVLLVQPKVLYEFADPTLEALPSGQKMLLRSGVANERRIKAKLREIRTALTGGPTKQ